MASGPTAKAIGEYASVSTGSAKVTRSGRAPRPAMASTSPSCSACTASSMSAKTTISTVAPTFRAISSVSATAHPPLATPSTTTAAGAIVVTAATRIGPSVASQSRWATVSRSSGDAGEHAGTSSTASTRIVANEDVGTTRW